MLQIDLALVEQVFPSRREGPLVELSSHFTEKLRATWDTVPAVLAQFGIQARTVEGYERGSQMRLALLLRILVTQNWLENDACGLPEKTWQQADHYLRRLSGDQSATSNVNPGAEGQGEIGLPQTAGIGRPETQLDDERSFRPILRAILDQTTSFMAWVKHYQPGDATSPALLFGGDAKCEHACSVEEVLREMIFRPKEWSLHETHMIKPFPEAWDAIRQANDAMSASEWIRFVQRNKLYLNGRRSVVSEVYVPLLGVQDEAACVGLRFNEKKTNDELLAIGRDIQPKCRDLALELFKTRVWQMGHAQEILRFLQMHQCDTAKTQNALNAALGDKIFQESVVLDQICKEAVQILGSKRVVYSRNDISRVEVRGAKDDHVLAQVVDQNALLETLLNLANVTHAMSPEPFRLEFGLVDGMPLVHLTMYATLNLAGLFQSTLIQDKHRLVLALDTREFFPPTVEWRQTPFNALAQAKIIAALSCGFLALVDLSMSEQLTIAIRMYFPRGIPPLAPTEDKEHRILLP